MCFYKKEDFQNYRRGGRVIDDNTAPLKAKNPKLEQKVTEYIFKMAPTGKLKVSLKSQIEKFNKQHTPVTTHNPRYSGRNLNTMAIQSQRNPETNRNRRTRKIGQRLGFIRSI